MQNVKMVLSRLEHRAKIIDQTTLTHICTQGSLNYYEGYGKPGRGFDNAFEFTLTLCKHCIINFDMHYVAAIQVKLIPFAYKVSLNKFKPG